MVTFLKLLGIGIITILVYIVVSDFIKAKEYPDLSLNDTFSNKVEEFSTEHGAVFIDLESGKGFRIFELFKLDEKEGSLSEVITVGDLILKKANSDTLVLIHEGEKFKYIIKGLK